MTRPGPTALALALVVATMAAPALAGDVWTEPYAGVRYLHRSTSQPKEIHALVVDLTRPEITLRATKSSEKGRTPSSFSTLVGAAAVVNGDFYNTDGSFDPVGLAIGEGTRWSDDSTGRHFVACALAGPCTIETTAAVTPIDASWRSAVGGNQILVKDGVKVWDSAQDSACGSFCTTAHPRTAAGVSQDGDELILVVVEGRQDPIFGMTLNQLAALMLELGSHTAINLDGGGSSTMVVAGARVSGRPANEPSERPVANHLAVIWSASAATTGKLVGFVRESDIYDTDAGLAGVDVSLSDGQATTTAESGYYEFLDVAPGEVTVTAAKAGYVTAAANKLVEVGITNWKSIALEPEPTSPPPPVEPDAGPPPVEEEPDAGPAPVEDVDAGPSEAEPEPDAGPAGEGEGEGAEGEDEGAAVDDDAPEATGESAPEGGCNHGRVAPSGRSAYVVLAILAVIALVAGRRRRAS